MIVGGGGGGGRRGMDVVVVVVAVRAKIAKEKKKRASMVLMHCSVVAGCWLLAAGLGGQEVLCKSGNCAGFSSLF